MFKLFFSVLQCGVIMVRHRTHNGKVLSLIPGHFAVFNTLGKLLTRLPSSTNLGIGDVLWLGT